MPRYKTASFVENAFLNAFESKANRIAEKWKIDRSDGTSQYDRLFKFWSVKNKAHEFVSYWAIYQEFQNTLDSFRWDDGEDFYEKHGGQNA